MDVDDLKETNFFFRLINEEDLKGRKKRGRGKNLAQYFINLESGKCCVRPLRRGGVLPVREKPSPAAATAVPFQRRTIRM